MKTNNHDIEYDIYLNDIVVGSFLTIEDPAADYYFGREIHIDDKYKRRGIAQSIISEYLNQIQKPFRLCIATESSSAVGFWENYFKNSPYKVKSIRGAIYEISKM